MSKLLISALAAGIVIIAGIPAVVKPVQAADLLRPVAHVRAHHATIDCGPCGCLHLTYVYHRELQSTYGIGFDPRSFDQTEPYYYWGRVRAFPRFWVDADPMH